MEIIENDRTIIKNPSTGHYLELDIWLPSIRCAIEYNGTYWHSNDSTKTRDLIKEYECKKSNIHLLVLHEDNWKSYQNESKAIIMEFINEYSS